MYHKFVPYTFWQLKAQNDNDYDDDKEDKGEEWRE